MLLCQPTESDAESLFDFLGNEDAMRHTHCVQSINDLRHRLAVHEAHRLRNRQAPWTVRCSASRAVIGWGGMYHDPFDPGWGIEVAYFFSPNVWGQGLASELVLICTDIADASGTSALQAFAHPDNMPSRKVLDKNGFLEVEFVAEMTRLRYERSPLTRYAPEVRRPVCE